MSTKTKKKTTAKARPAWGGSSLTLKGKPIVNKWTVILLVAVLAAFGAWRLFFASAATNNCQAENGVSICDVDETGGGGDTVLSTGGEAASLGTQGWGVYYGAAFRAPTKTYQGAVPVHRVYNAQYTWHDWVTDAQKRDKEAKYGGNNYEGVAFFAWENGNVAGTVPVYRITRGGGASQSMFSTDKAWVDRIVAEGANDPNGWKSGTTMPAIAFYAFPPNYKVAGQQNPYDCSILENYVSDRCTAARTNLNNAVAAGNVPTSNDCPKTLDVYRKAPFPGQFSADCQKFWNTYMQDCKITENFTSDRCKTQREALATAQAEQVRQRAAAAAKAKSGGGGSGSGGGGGGGDTPASTAGTNCADPAQQQSDFCKSFFSAIKNAQTAYADAYKTPATGILWSGLYAYNCHISGERRAKTTNNTLDSSTYWYKAGLDKTFLAGDSGSAKRLCVTWRSQINSLDDYRGFEITSVKKK